MTAKPSPLGGAVIVRKGESAPEEVAPRVSVPVKAGTIAVTLRLDPDRYEKLKSLSGRTRRTNQDILQSALDAYLRREGSC